MVLSPWTRMRLRGMHVRLPKQCGGCLRQTANNSIREACECFGVSFIAPPSRNNRFQLTPITGRAPLPFGFDRFAQEAEPRPLVFLRPGGPGIARDLGRTSESSSDQTGKDVAGESWNRKKSVDNVKSNPTGADTYPAIGRPLNGPACDVFVHADVGRQANREHRGVADSSGNGQFAGEGMNPLTENCEHNTTQQCAHNHDRHVGIERAVGGLMEFNVGRYGEAGHCACKPYPVDEQAAGG